MKMVYFLMGSSKTDILIWVTLYIQNKLIHTYITAMMVGTFQTRFVGNKMTWNSGSSWRKWKSFFIRIDMIRPYWFHEKKNNVIIWKINTLCLKIILIIPWWINAWWTLDSNWIELQTSLKGNRLMRPS